MSTKKQLLDPLGSMCKLIALKFKKLNTKISIIDHVVSLDEPKKILGVEVQGAKRWWYDQEQADIAELYYVIIRLIKWYIIAEDQTENNSEESQQDEDDIVKSDELLTMVDYLCIALSKLQKTYYKSGLVIFALQFFINLLREALEGNMTLEILEKRRLPMVILKDEEEYDNLIDYDKLKKLWKLSRLKKIYELYNDCFKVKYDKEIPKETKKALIEGYLTGITSTLDIVDKDFQILISNSTKG
jgi:hypothetical protein